MLRTVLGSLSPELRARSEGSSQLGPFVEYLYFMFAAAEMAQWEDIPLASALTDGPDLPQHFNFGGQSKEVPGLKLYAFIKYLWSRRNRTAESSELAKPVWREHSRPITVGRCGSMCREANRFFKKYRFPFRIKTRTEDDNRLIIYMQNHAWTDADIVARKKKRPSPKKATRKKRVE